MTISTFPAALLCAPRANAPRAIVRASDSDPTQLFAELNSAVRDMRANSDARLTAIEAAVNDRLTFNATDALGNLGGGSGIAPDPEYTALFASYFRGGREEEAVRAANAVGHRATVQAAMSTSSDSNGGYLAPVEWDRTIAKAQLALSPIRRLATVRTTGVAAYTTLWHERGWGTGWVGETAARPATTTGTLLPITFPTGEIYANPSATQRLLDDAEIKVEEWITSEVTEEFDRQEGVAFVSGDGVNKPMGFLQYVVGGTGAATHPGGTLSVAASGSADSIPGGDVLVDFTYGLAAPYRQNATWVMNSSTAAAIAKMKDGQGNYIWREGLIAGQPATLLGRPVELDEAMPNIGANALAIAFGDFRAGYLINDRIGTRVLRDPYTNKPFVTFYTTKRVGGGVADPNAIRLLKIAA